MKVIAIQSTEQDSNDTLVDFYGLTQIDETINDYNNGLLESLIRCQLTIQVMEQQNTTTFRYSSIPTEEDNSSLDLQLAKYCTASTTTKWVLLEGYEDIKIWVLGISTVQIASRNKVEHTPPPSITFNFPGIVTLEDIVKLEQNATDRHHCNMVQCSDLLICPTTFDDPVPTIPLHSHCTWDKCVRFYEMNPPPTQFMFPQ